MSSAIRDNNIKLCEIYSSPIMLKHLGCSGAKPEVHPDATQDPWRLENKFFHGDINSEADSMGAIDARGINNQSTKRLTITQVNVIERWDREGDAKA